MVSNEKLMQQNKNCKKYFEYLQIWPLSYIFSASNPPAVRSTFLFLAQSSCILEPWLRQYASESRTNSPLSCRPHIKLGGWVVHRSLARYGLLAHLLPGAQHITRLAETWHRHQHRKWLADFLHNECRPDELWISQYAAGHRHRTVVRLLAQWHTLTTARKLHALEWHCKIPLTQQNKRQQSGFQCYCVRPFRIHIP